MKVTPAEEAALRALWDHDGSVKLAAHALRKSPRTVEQQLASARERLGAKSKWEAVRVVIVDREPAA
jgi:DNA-binding CsgD family transcriptional regulator